MVGCFTNHFWNGFSPPRLQCQHLASAALQPQEKLGKDLEQAAARYAKSPEVLLKAGPAETGGDGGPGRWCPSGCSLQLFKCKVVSFQGFKVKKGS